VGVTQQYCGQLGKQDNCQVAVTLSLANRDASLPVAYRLYLPEDWAKDQGLRHKAKIPGIAFQTKRKIALEQMKEARALGLPEGVVLMDVGYGNDTELRTAITALGMSYVGGILTTTTVWPAGTAPSHRPDRGAEGHRPGSSARQRASADQRQGAGPEPTERRARAVRSGCPHALPASGCEPPIVTPSCATRAPRSGC
jgi:SRSO17 transposase